MSVMSDVITDASHDGATQGAQTSRSDDDVRHRLLLACRANELSWLLDVGEELAVDLRQKLHVRTNCRRDKERGVLVKGEGGSTSTSELAVDLRHMLLCTTR